VKHVNQIDIAAWLGISQGHLSNILAGRKPLTIQVMRTISELTGVSLDKIDRMHMDKLERVLTKRYRK
jgi:transcriptional regulator with XRE-family HTH domain